MPAASDGPFPQTRHSMVADLRSDRADVRRSAYDALVAAYWKPVFKYVRLKWHAAPEEAADLTQGFFLRAFEKAFFATFDPAKARFRTYLRTCLDGFVANERKAERRLKRGGAHTIVSVDFNADVRAADDSAGFGAGGSPQPGFREPDFRDAESELQQQRAHASAIQDFDAYFHREWLRSLFAASADRLRAACTQQGRSQRFTVFERYDLVSEEDQRPTYAQLAADLGLTATTVTNELAAARREFRRIVLAVLREQCATDEEYAAEARTLTGGAADDL
jgi:RNA polymerase sigma factor (sigma-70 family)